MVQNIFAGRRLVIATKHQKERVIEPVLNRKLGVKCFTDEGIDTDLLGTFTGEVERKDDPLTTAKNKCLLAMELTNCDLAVASEGSFGTNTSAAFFHSDDEILLLIDKQNGLEIVVKEVSTATNFSGGKIISERQLNDFAVKVLFPSHGLILRKANDDFTEVVKGVTDWENLRKTFHYFLDKYGSAYIETDMRALYNPTRMKVIEKATLKLVEKINSCCPQCQMPGFGVTDAKLGLPCALCGFPTKSVISYIYSCQKCNFSNEDLYPNKKKLENPMFCDICNP